MWRGVRLSAKARGASGSLKKRAARRRVRLSAKARGAVAEGGGADKPLEGGGGGVTDVRGGGGEGKCPAGKKKTAGPKLKSLWSYILLACSSSMDAG